MSAMVVHQPAVALRTVPVLMVPRLVSTPVTRAVLDVDAGDFGVLVDVDAALVGLAGIAPHHRVMADDAAGRVIQRGQDRVARLVAHVELRAERLISSG